MHCVSATVPATPTTTTLGNASEHDAIPVVPGAAPLPVSEAATESIFDGDLLTARSQLCEKRARRGASSLHRLSLTQQLDPRTQACASVNLLTRQPHSELLSVSLSLPLTLRENGSLTSLSRQAPPLQRWPLLGLGSLPPLGPLPGLCRLCLLGLQVLRQAPDQPQGKVKVALPKGAQRRKHGVHVLPARQHGVVGVWVWAMFGCPAAQLPRSIVTTMLRSSARARSAEAEYPRTCHYH